MAETIFQVTSRKYDEWVSNGQQGSAPARLAFDHSSVRAWVDPYRKLPGAIVVVPTEGTPGEEAHVRQLPDHRQDQMSRVCSVLAANMLAATGLRAIEHIEGYGVPDHAHIVMFPAARGEGRALYEQVDRPNEATLEAELDNTLAKFGIQGVQAVLLGRRLDALESMAILLDEPMLPEGTLEAVGDLADRALLCT